MPSAATTATTAAPLARLTLAVAAIAWFEWRRPTGRVGTALGLVGGLALAPTFGFTGHAVAGSQRPLSLGSDLLHVAAMAVWLGGLLMLALVTLRAEHEPVDAVRRFSRLATASVAALVVTGTWQAWRQVSEWAALTGTAYGRELLVKVGLVGALLVAAGFSRTWVVARRRPLEVHASTAGAEITASAAPPRLPGWIRRSVAAEAMLGVVVLAVTSTLVATEPARTAYHPSVATTLTLGPDTVQVSAVPAGDRSMEIHLYVFDASGQLTRPAELTASVTLPDQELGPLPVTLQSVDRGHDVGTIAVPLRGDGQLEVHLRTTSIDAFTATTPLPIR